MSWIRETDENPWNVYNVMSLNPKAMRAMIRFGQAAAHGGSPLTLAQEEAIATVVSVINRVPLLNHPPRKGLP